MTKVELIQKLAADHGLSKAEAGRIIDNIFATITTKMVNGEDVVIPGFATFTSRNRAERNGRNPKTGETIIMRAHRVPAIRWGSQVKKSVR